MKTGWRKTAGGGTGKVSDVSIVTEDLSGSPSLSQLLTSEEQQRYLSIDSGNRFNVVVCDIHRAIEHRRELGDVYEKAAHEMYRECDTILVSVGPFPNPAFLFYLSAGDCLSIHRDIHD